MAGGWHWTTQPGALGDPFIADRAEEVHRYPDAPISLIPVAVHTKFVGSGLWGLCTRWPNDIRGAGHFHGGNTTVTRRLWEPVHDFGLYIAITDLGELTLVGLFLLALEQGHCIFLVSELGDLGRLFEVEPA